MSVSHRLINGFTEIGWTEWSYNPWIGCVEVSPGCANCYADQQWGAGSRFNRAKWGSEKAGGTRSGVSPLTFLNPFRWHKLASEAANLWALDLEPGELYPPVQSKAKRPGELKHWTLLDQMGLLERVGDAVMCRKVPWRNPTVFCASLADIFEDWTMVEWCEFARGYRISIYGQIESRRQLGSGSDLSSNWKSMQCGLDAKGYRRVKIDGKKRFVHSLVLETFVGEKPDGMECRHLDGNPRNNNLWNLCYGTGAENWGDRRRHGTATGVHAGGKKLTPMQVDEIKAAYSRGEKQTEIAPRYGISNSLVSLIVRGKSWSEAVAGESAEILRLAARGQMVDHMGRPLFHEHAGYSHSPEGSSELWRPVTMDDVRARVLEMIDLTPDLTWLLLTKRIENVAAVFRDAARPNVMIGSSIENQAMADRRIPHLLEAERHGVGTFISAEPLLGPVNLRAYYKGRTKPGWVIAGCESGPSARPCDNNWIMGVADSARDAGVPVFVKQAIVDGELVRSLASLPSAIRYQDKPGFYDGELV